MAAAALILTAALMLPVTSVPSQVAGGSQSVDSPGTTATIVSDAPIFIRPNATTPLRVASPQTTLNVLSEQGEWVEVEFQDPQWGQRVGWVERKFINIQKADLRPMDLSVKSPTREPGSVAPTTPQGIPVNNEQLQAPRDVVGHPQTREGFWFNAGLGFGSAGCQDCDIRTNGLSGGLSLGWTVNPRVLLGMGTSGWTRTTDGSTVTVGTLDFRVRVYPAIKSGFFLTGGIGLGTLTVDGDSEYGAGAILGVGWDIRVARNVSLTPFWNGFAMNNANSNANVGQIGLGVTIH